MSFLFKQLAIFIVMFGLTSLSLNAQSDLSITKTVNNATPNVGDEITFTITIHNEGPNVATGVTVRDVIPSGYGNLTNVSNGGSAAGTTVLWPNLTIPVGVNPSDDIVLTVNVTVLASGEYNNRAEIIASDQTDPDSDPSLSFDQDDGLDGTPDGVDDDETNIVTVVPMRADLSLTKTVDNPTPNIGDTVVFTVTVTNDGPDTATGVAIQDVVPSGYGNITNISNGGSTSGSIINWTGLTVSSGQSIPLTITATILPTGEYNNRAEITASDVNDLDSDPSSSFDDDDYLDGIADDDETDFVIVTPTVSDLSLAKEVEILDNNPVGGRPHRGTNVVFTITVANDGPEDASNVTVRDILPQGYIYLSDDGDYNPTTGIWTIGDIVNGASVSLNITAVIGLIDEYVNTAEIVTSNFDPDSTPDNNDPTEDDQDSASVDPIDIFIPEGFSPNGDNINETFVVPGLGFLYPDFKMEIYNRWGNKVFDYSNQGRANPQWWDGFSNGNLNFNGSEQVPAGTYYYIIYFNQDNLDPISNWVYLNR